MRDEKCVAPLKRLVTKFELHRLRKRTAKAKTGNIIQQRAGNAANFKDESALLSIPAR